MCGIAGIVGGNVFQHRNIIPEMLDSVKHRGPDGRGEKYFAHCALGHVRLSIIDIDNGTQPMLDYTGRLCVVFNGEIYGYRDIKRELPEYQFKTNCDTEVILALYESYREKMLTHLPGMFSFALWDEADNTLFCARDRFGEKPFFYCWGDNGEFIFASEIKAILATGLITPVIDHTQLNHFLCYSYIYPTKTIYKNIYTLPPAHCLTLAENKIKVWRYWNMPMTNEAWHEDEAVERFKQLFSQAVERQLVADVPVGAFLSGGMDSSSVVAVAAQFSPNLTTISFGFRGGVNELDIAKTMARKYHTNHIELEDVDFNLAELLLTLSQFYDEPMADPASIPTYLLAKHVRQYVKVVLTGDGGDELLGGYDSRYRVINYMLKWKNSPHRWKEKMLDWYFCGFRFLREQARRYGWYSSDPSVRLHEQRYHDIFLRKKAFRWLKEGHFDDNRTLDVVRVLRDKEKFVQQNIVDTLNLHHDSEDYLLSAGFLPDCENPENALRLDLQEYLPGNGMRKTDRMTMAVGLESRTPFLDMHLAEFCISLPFNLRLNEQSEKYILKKSYAKQWSEEVRRTIKNGFAAPLHLWLKRPELKNLLHEYMVDRTKRLFDLVDYKQVQYYLHENRKHYLLWELLILSIWLEKRKCVL